MKTAVFVALALFGAVYIVIWISYIRRSKTKPGKPAPLHYAIGAVTNFLDALGIGSFATTTALFRTFRVVAANLLLGALMTLGIGLFAPCMMITYLMGMNPRAVFPIMMGSVAFLGPVASVPFIRRGAYNLEAALGLTLGGIPAILAAAFI